MRPEGQKIVYNIGIAIGILGGLIGMAVAIAASPIFGSIFSLFFILIFGFVFGGMFLRNRKNKQLLENGRQANGKIIEMWDTGVTINNQPQVGMVIEVSPQTGMPFKSEVKLVISRLQTAYYQVGVNCVVRYDPNNTKTVAIESIGGNIGSQTVSSGGYNSYSNQYNDSSNQNFQGSSYFPGKSPAQIEEDLKTIDLEVKRIIQIGTECRAIIKNCDFTNVYVNGENPLNAFILEVIPDNQPAYEAKCFGVVLAKSVQKYQPGKQIWVKYDPSDKNKVTLSHS